MDIYASENEFLVSLFTCQKDQSCYEINFNKNFRKKYDGSFTYTIDATNMECYYYVEALSWWEPEYAILNYLTIIYEENYNFFDYKSYKSAVLKEINK